MNLLSPMDLQMHLHQRMLYTQQQMTLHHHRPEEIAHPNGWIIPPSPGAGPSLPRDVKMELQNKRLWQQFHAESTEMIITKLGRRMFPSIQLNVSGLESRARYCLLLEVAPASRRRHKYVGGAGTSNEDSKMSSSGGRGWTSAGPAEPQPRIDRRVYLHPDSPATGHHWMQHPVSFSKLKLTNNAVDHHNNVVLTSMHKYVPRIWIIRCDDLASVNNLYNQPSASFTFDETEFIAVTAYQNENITKLKIDNNPFAKGFRETGQSRCKRKLRHDNQADEEEAGSVSSSESESQEKRSRIRAVSEAGSLDDSGISSSGGITPPLIAHSPSPNYDQSPSRIAVPNNEPNNDEPRQTPRLHRPWTDSSPSTQIQDSRQSFATTTPSSTLPPEVGLFHPLFVPSHHPEFVALQVARIHHRIQQQQQQQQQFRYQSQQHFAQLYR